MNENKAIALEIIKLQGQTRSAKESAEKYNEVLEVLDSHGNSKNCTGEAVNGISGEVRKLTKIEVLTNTLRDAGFFIVDYKSNHDDNESLTGLVIAPLKD